MGSNPVGVTTSWGYSSAGRARALQARGHRFEPCCPHHIKKRATLCVVLFLCIGKQHRARIRRFLRLCSLRAPLCPGHTARSAHKCKHFRFAVDEPCCPHQQKSASRRCAVFVVWDNLWARTQPNGWRSAVACKRLRYAPCVTLQTLCVVLLFILDLHYAEHALLSHVINCAFDQTNAFYLFVCLMLVYSFSPRVHSIPRGPR